MRDFASIDKVPLREIWPNEARDFTPWLAENIDELGDALGLELELVEREAAVGDFSLDLLAKDLGTSQMVIVENQIAPTDHDHLGKLLTYAAGFDASIVVWVAEHIREEHRQALEWLNQRTDSATQFFGVITEVLRIDGSRPALNFKPIVFPNEWRKSKKSAGQPAASEKGEKYRMYFQRLIDKLREEYKFTGARVGQAQNWYSFASGIAGITYGANFAMGNRARTEIYIDTGDCDRNKQLFDVLRSEATALEHAFGSSLDWERMDSKRGSRIAVYRDGAIDCPDSELEEILAWHTENLLTFKRVFGERVKQELANNFD